MENLVSIKELTNLQESCSNQLCEILGLLYTNRLALESFNRSLCLEDRLRLSKILSSVNLAEHSLDAVAEKLSMIQLELSLYENEVPSHAEAN